jgi:branched-chain amino acid transport system ATP-binding protein
VVIGQRAPRAPNAENPVALLRLQDVHVYIAGSHILQGMTFEVMEGKTTVMIGRNGAGKSTTLRTIMGILQPLRGSITLAGREIGGNPSHIVARHGIAFVPEDREVFVSLTVEENLKLAQRSGASLGAGGIEQAYALFPDLQAARARSAGALSGGQQQMLAIARALVNRNHLLLIDEPTKGLAPVIVQQLQSIFRSLHDEGETIVLVEQNLQFARAVGDRFYIVDDGRVVHGGPMEELDADPELLRQFVGV